MSVEPGSTGSPPREADDYVSDANAGDPRDDRDAPAGEPAAAGEGDASPSTAEPPD